MREDKIEIEILEDGQIKVVTDQISPANHLNADEFLAYISELAGGQETREKRKHGHTHVRQQQHVGHSH